MLECTRSLAPYCSPYTTAVLVQYAVANNSLAASQHRHRQAAPGRAIDPPAAGRASAPWLRICPNGPRRPPCVFPTQTAPTNRAPPGSTHAPPAPLFRPKAPHSRLSRAASPDPAAPPFPRTMLSRGFVLLLSATVIHARLDIAGPGCHDATVAWLRVQARSDDPETRRSARHLLRKHGYEILDDARPPPRRRDPLRPRSPRRDPLRPRSRRREDPPRPSRRLQGSGNDGPALRAAFRPVAGTQEEWLQAVGWPTDADANPCDGDGWSRVNCDNGHVKRVDLSDKPLPGYELQPAVANLEQLETLCAPARPSSSPFPPGADTRTRQVSARHGAVRHAAERHRQPRAAGILVRPRAAFLAVPPRGLTRGRGRYLESTALSGTLPSDIGNLTQLETLCAPARPSSPFPPQGLTRGRGRVLSGTALSGTLPSEIDKLGQLETLCAPARPSLAVPPRGLTRGRGRYLFSTALSGTLPSDIGKLGQLQDLCAPARPPSPFPPGA
eukprot:SAG25_NODE_66_length_17563_cov_34.737918_15_plen_499_part_00